MTIWLLDQIIIEDRGKVPPHPMAGPPGHMLLKDAMGGAERSPLAFTAQEHQRH